MQIVKKEGFSLIEIVIVMGIIGFLFSFLIPRVFKYMKQSESKQYLMKLGAVKEGIITYKMNFNKNLYEKDGLITLTNQEMFKKTAGIDAPLKQEDIVDQNGREIIYHCPPQKYKDEYRAFELLWVGEGTEDEPQAHDGN